MIQSKALNLITIITMMCFISQNLWCLYSVTSEIHSIFKIINLHESEMYIHSHKHYDITENKITITEHCV